jgi:hypothetical protein
VLFDFDRAREKGKKKKEDSNFFFLLSTKVYSTCFSSLRAES